MYPFCAHCGYHGTIWYADGHASIRCLHPNNDPRTTRDIVIMSKCPEGKGPKLKQDMKDEIVLHKGKPAMVLCRKEGKTVTLMVSRNHFKTVLESDVEPYTGDGDAVSLGFKDAE